MDIDDEELAFVNATEPLDPDKYFRQHTSLPYREKLDGKTWTQLAIGLADIFGGVSVSNPALQQRYGGEIIRHARDERRFIPTPALRQQSRQTFGIPTHSKVVLFFGTPRKHKGLLDIAQILDKPFPM